MEGSHILILDASFIILTFVLRSLQVVSAFWFSVLGLLLFGAYVLLKNSVGGVMPYAVLQVADLPFALSALTYGGTSFLLSIAPGGKVSKALAAVTVVGVLGIFGMLAWLNYLPLFQ